MFITWILHFCCIYSCSHKFLYIMKYLRRITFCLIGYVFIQIGLLISFVNYVFFSSCRMFAGLWCCFLFCFISSRFYINWETFSRIPIYSDGEFYFIPFVLNLGIVCLPFCFHQTHFRKRKRRMIYCICPYFYSSCCSFFFPDVPNIFSFLPAFLSSFFSSFFSCFCFKNFF